jgi:hypothetical protein
MTVHTLNSFTGNTGNIGSSYFTPFPSNVVPIGKDTFQLSMTGVGFATQANTNIKALKAAGDYCDKMGKQIVFQHSSESGVYGFSPRQDSLDANDPAYTRTEVRRDPAIIVQTQ